MAITPATLLIASDIRRRMLDMTNAQVLALTQAWVNAWDLLQPEFQDSLEDILSGNKTVTRAMLAKNKRLLAALEQARSSLDALAAGAVNTIELDLMDAVLEAARGGVAIGASQLPPGTVAVGISFDLPATASLDAIVARSLQQIHSNFLPLPADVERLMKASLIRGVAVGDNPRTTARRMVKQAGSRFNGGLARATNIARTETLDAHRAGALATAKANEDILTGWVWSAQLDARTCPSCLVQHGDIHSVDDPGPLDHQMGRCARIDKTKTWRELGFNIDEPADATPNAREWYDGLTEETQRSIMGPERQRLLADGAVKWEDLSTRVSSPGWRDSMHTTSVKNLLNN